MCEHVDLPTLDALQAEWRLHPPVHHLVASYLGYKAPSNEPAKVITDFEEIASSLGGVPIRVIAPLDTTAFDQAMQKAQDGRH